MQDRNPVRRILISGHTYLLRRGLASTIRGIVPSAEITDVSSLSDLKERLEREEFFAAIFDIDSEYPIEPIKFQEIRVANCHVILGVLSRSDDASVALSYLAAGVNGYILGYSSQAEIEDAIRTIFRGATYVPPALLRPAADQLISSPGVNRPCRDQNLTSRQNDVLKMVLNGCSNKEIARELRLSPNTVKIHVGALLRHFAVERRTDLSLAASQNGNNGTYGHAAPEALGIRT